jgi:hypothetical protein
MISISKYTYYIKLYEFNIKRVRLENMKLYELRGKGAELKGKGKSSNPYSV